MSPQALFYPIVFLTEQHGIELINFIISEAIVTQLCPSVGLVKIEGEIWKTSAPSMFHFL